MTATKLAWALATPALLMAACVQDPYLVPHDGGFVAEQPLFPDGVLPPDGGVDQGRDADAAADLSFDACRALPEICNNIDDNCNDQIDEDFDKISDPRYCDSCRGCQWLFALNAVPICVDGQCAIGGCAAGYINADGEAFNGCEKPCTYSGPIDYCDGVDNDCNGEVDDLPQTCTVDGDCAAYGAGSVCQADNRCSLPQICAAFGPCRGQLTSCQQDSDCDWPGDRCVAGQCRTVPRCQGEHGWVCNYGPPVELFSCADDAECGSSTLGCVGASAGACEGSGAPCFRDSDCGGSSDGGPADGGASDGGASDGGADAASDAGADAAADAATGGRCVGAQLGTCPGVVAVEEQRCDGVDGDCDDVVDDPWTNPALATALGRPCVLDPTKLGICRARAAYACAPDGSGAVCTLLQGGASPRDEDCNGLDDDCDGEVDEEEDDAAGAGVVDEMVLIPGLDVYIYAYEASRPDATDTAGGESSARSCSREGVLPWNNVSFADAAAACAAAGKRLCTRDEWLAACQGTGGLPYPYGEEYEPQSCNGVDRGSAGPLPVGSLQTCEGGLPLLFDLSGNVREWTTEVGGSTTSTPPKTIYVVRGGAYHTPATGLSCQFSLSQAVEDVVLPAIGFRCCSDDPP